MIKYIIGLVVVLSAAVYNFSQPVVEPIVEPAPVVLPSPVVSPKPIFSPVPVVPTEPVISPTVPTIIPRPIAPGVLPTPTVPTTGIVAPSTTVTPGSVVIFSRDLNLNFSGADVKSFQQYLFDQKFLTVSPTGFFGPATCAAAKAWKVSQRLAADTCFIGPLSRAILNRNLVGLGGVVVEKKANPIIPVVPPSGPYKVEANFVNQSNPANAQVTISKVVPAPVITSLSNVTCPCAGLSCSNAPACTTAYMSGTQVKAQITSPSVVGYSWIFRNYVPGPGLGTGYPAVTKIAGCSQIANAQDTFCEFIMPAQAIEIHIEASSPPPPPPPPISGKITVIKKTFVGNNQSFVSTPFTFNLTGPSSASTVLDTSSSTSTPSSAAFTVAPGIYTLKEVLPSSWFMNAGDISCSPTGNITISGLPAPTGVPTVQINVTSGSNTTCTFSNRIVT